MAVTPEMIAAVRIEVQDVDPSLPILPDETYNYILTKNNENILRSSLDAARIILMRLSLTSQDITVDVLSLKDSKAIQAYKEALILYLRDPNLNSMLNTVNAYAGGVSTSDMQANNTASNNFVRSPTEGQSTYAQPSVPSTNPFLI